MNAKRNPLPLLCLLCAVAAALTACSVPGEERWPHLTLLVADEAKAYARDFGGALTDYKIRGGVIVTMEQAPSAEVAARLARPTPPDLVLLGDPALVRTLAERKLIEPAKWRLERQRDKVVLAVGKDSPLRAERLEDLRRPEFKAIGLTGVMNSHVGQIAERLIVDHNLYHDLEHRLQRYDDQDALVRAIETGAVQAGLIRESGLKQNYAGRVRALLTIDPAAGVYPPYVALAVCRGTKNPIPAHNAWSFLETCLRNGEMFIIDAADVGNMFKLSNMAQ